LQLDFQVSRLELVFLVICHILASYSVWQSGWPMPLSLALTAVLAGHAWYQLYRCLFLLENSVLRANLKGQGRAWLTTPGGDFSASLQRVAYLSALLILLDFKVIQDSRKRRCRWIPARKKIRILVTAGSVPIVQRKQLACFLTYGM